MFHENEEFPWAEAFGEESNRFVKIAKVGKGTYGYVYKAYPKGNSSLNYALKKIKPDKERDDGFPLTALREIKILQCLDHKNIVKLHGIITSKRASQNKFRRSTYLVLEYMEHDFYSLQRTVQFTYPEIKCLMKQLLQGLHYLHSKSIIHRDQKTGNLLLNNKGEIKIADFGLARYHLDHRHKLTDNVVTFWYRAPEIIFGNQMYTSKIDVWSVGCIFAELLMKTPLFRGTQIEDQTKLFYEKLGTPDDDWPEVREYRYWNILKPKKKYQKTLRTDIREKFPEADDHCLDLFEKMLCYNPDRRISAKIALEHPFFTTEPLPCRPSQIKKMEMEYHDCLIREKEYKAQIERQYEQSKREMRERGDHAERFESSRKQVESKKTGINRLESLFGSKNPPANQKSDHQKSSQSFFEDELKSEDKFDKFAHEKKSSKSKIRESSNIIDNAFGNKRKPDSKDKVSGFYEPKKKYKK